MRRSPIVQESHDAHRAQAGTVQILEPSETVCDHEIPHMGWRECSVAGCPCRAFVQSYGSDLCGNCGHKYTDHW